MQPEEQMQLWLLSLLFDQTVTTENTHSLAVFRGRRTDARPALWHHLIDIHNEFFKLTTWPSVAIMRNQVRLVAI